MPRRTDISKILVIGSGPSLKGRGFSRAEQGNKEGGFSR